METVYWEYFEIHWDCPSCGDHNQAYTSDIGEVVECQNCDTEYKLSKKPIN